MKQILAGPDKRALPAVIAGCMRITKMETSEVDTWLHTCMDLGITFFDHADIYGSSANEKKFGEIFAKSGIKREDVVIQSKCGIIPDIMYDSSKEHILKSVDEILRRLQMDYLDNLLIHRPDALVEPEEVAEAFDKLYSAGKVRHFGVSNHTPMQIELLKKYVQQPIEYNQMQFSAPFSNMVACGMEANMLTDGANSRDGYVLDYCRLHDITIQAWSPFQYGFFEGTYIGSEKYPELNRTLDELAQKYDTTSTGIAAAWILRHPAQMQMIAGTTNLSRLTEIAKASEIILTREEWYRIYLASGHILP